MACATLGCGRQTPSPRAKFCPECCLKSAHADSSKRQSFRGGVGVVSNKGGHGVLGNKHGDTPIEEKRGIVIELGT